MSDYSLQSGALLLSYMNKEAGQAPVTTHEQISQGVQQAPQQGALDDAYNMYNQWVDAYGAPTVNGVTGAGIGAAAGGLLGGWKGAAGLGVLGGALGAAYGAIPGSGFGEKIDYIKNWLTQQFASNITPEQAIEWLKKNPEMADKLLTSKEAQDMLIERMKANPQLLQQLADNPDVVKNLLPALQTQLPKLLADPANKEMLTGVMNDPTVRETLMPMFMEQIPTLLADPKNSDMLGSILNNPEVMNALQSNPQVQEKVRSMLREKLMNGNMIPAAINKFYDEHPFLSALMPSREEAIAEAKRRVWDGVNNIELSTPQQAPQPAPGQPTQQPAQPAQTPVQPAQQAPAQAAAQPTQTPATAQPAPAKPQVEGVPQGQLAKAYNVQQTPAPAPSQAPAQPAQKPAPAPVPPPAPAPPQTSSNNQPANFNMQDWRGINWGNALGGKV